MELKIFCFAYFTKIYDNVKTLRGPPLRPHKGKILKRELCSEHVTHHPDPLFRTRTHMLQLLGIQLLMALGSTPHEGSAVSPRKHYSAPTIDPGKCLKISPAPRALPLASGWLTYRYQSTGLSEGPSQLPSSP